MKKYTLFLLLSICTIVSVQAQIAKWLLKPQYDSIEITENNLFKITSNGKIGLLNKDGEQILPAEFDSITSFHEGKALLFCDNALFGVTDEKGNITILEGRNYELTFKTNRFYNGLLLVKKDNKYYYINSYDKVVFGPYTQAYPFFDNHACIKYTSTAGKPQELSYNYMNLRDSLRVFEKWMEEDLSFMSSFHNGKAIVIFKKKFHTVDAKTHQFTPITSDPTSRKSKPIAFKGKEVNIVKCDEGYMIQAVNAKFVFDEFMRPKYWTVNGKDSVAFEYPSERKRHIQTSRLNSFKENKLYGLSFDGIKLLPAQFHEVQCIGGKHAIIKINDKYGVLTVDENNKIQFKLNNNENIGFNHQYFNAKLIALMPSYIKCSSATIKSHSEDCEIQIESRKDNENVERNALEYTCNLSIPKDLTDTLTNHDYYYSLKYDGLISMPQKVSISEWYVKYYEVKLSKTSLTLESMNDTIAIEFDLIKTDAARNDDSNYFKEVTAEAPSLPKRPIVNKITENHFAMLLTDINKDKVNFSVKITEVGCPSIEYPFEVIIKRPDPKQKDKRTIVDIKRVQKDETIVFENL